MDTTTDQGLACSLALGGCGKLDWVAVMHLHQLGGNSEASVMPWLLEAKTERFDCSFVQNAFVIPGVSVQGAICRGDCQPAHL